MPEATTIPGLPGARDPGWHVLRTRSNCEQRVHDQVAAKGYDVFLPRVNAWSRRDGQRRVTQVPMFPGYLFLHHRMDKASYLEVRQSIGLVAILGERWDRLEVVPDPEIEAIRRALRSSLPVFPHPYLHEGQRVRITRGPLTDIEGIVVRGNFNTGLLVISINMLCRSVAVELDCMALAAA